MLSSLGSPKDYVKSMRSLHSKLIIILHAIHLIPTGWHSLIGPFWIGLSLCCCQGSAGSPGRCGRRSY